MSQTTPVETIQHLYAAFGRGDLPAILERLDPQVKWGFVGSPGLAYTGHFTGVSAVQQWFTDVLTADEILDFQPREFFGGERHVTVIGWERSRDRGTGRSFDVDWIHLFELADDRITRFWGMYDTAASAAAR